MRSRNRRTQRSLETANSRRRVERVLAPLAIVFVALMMPAICCGGEEKEPTAEEQLAEKQRDIAKKFAHLDTVLQRLATLSESTDPSRAALLMKTRTLSKERLVEVRLEELIVLLGQGQLARALEDQQTVQQDLASLLELLMSEDRAKRIEAERTRVRRYLKQLNRLIRRQKEIQARTEADDDFDKLSSEQGDVAEQTGGLAKEIRKNEEDSSPRQDGSDKRSGEPATENRSPDTPSSEPKPGEPPQGQPENGEADGGDGEDAKRPSAQDEEGNPARRRLDDARRRMQLAKKKLDEAQREGAIEDQEEAIRALEQAKADFEEILRQLREEEIGRMLAMLETRFAEMLELQRVVYAGTVALGKIPEEQRTHNHEIEASRLSGKQTDIGALCDKTLLLLRDDGTSAAFPEAVGQMRDDMRQVTARLAQIKVGEITQAIEQDILAALEEMIEALQRAQDDLQQEKQETEQGRAKPSNESGDASLVNILAELKMIRALQMRVNRRTEQYSRLIDGEQAESAELIAALKQLAKREKRIHEVTRDLEMGRNQ